VQKTGKENEEAVASDSTSQEVVAPAKNKSNQLNKQNQNQILKLRKVILGT
jgi:hypothetical protein